ncbi:hypothetical protein [Streptomyces sp. NPDC101150]
MPDTTANSSSSCKLLRSKERISSPRRRDAIPGRDQRSVNDDREPGRYS